MRRIEIAPSFDREAEAIGAYIESRFDASAREKFVGELGRICTLIAFLPSLGKMRHGYDTKLIGYAFDQNWISFDFDDDVVMFLHIVNTKQNKLGILFDR
jgi:plasmid stabilization system protein ParE